MGELGRGERPFVTGEQETGIVKRRGVGGENRRTKERNGGGGKGKDREAEEGEAGLEGDAPLPG